MKSSMNLSESPIAGKRIVISGAGIAGLAFVVSLRALWSSEMGMFPDIVHFERDQSLPDLTREGYSISIRSGGISLGMQALQQMGLLDDVITAGVHRKDDEVAYLGLWSRDWRRMVNKRHSAVQGLPRSPMRIARAKLRTTLLAASGQTRNIHWGRMCTAAISTEDGRTRVLLDDGTEVLCDLLVIADGANSKLRASFRPQDTLRFAGPVSISAVSRFDGPPPEPIDKAWGIIPSGEGVSLFVSPMGDGSVNWCVSYIAKVPRKEYRQPMSLDLCDYLLQEAKERGAVFQEPFQTLVDHSDITTLMVFNAMDKPPFAHGIAHGIPHGVVSIGDSNHAVSAFAANGANMALVDGFDLAESLCLQGSISQAIEQYDKKSVPRASASLEGSRHHIAMVHSSGLRWSYHRIALLIYGLLLSFCYACKDLLHAVCSSPGVHGDE